VSEVAGTDNLAFFREARLEAYFTYLLLFVHSCLFGTHNWMWSGWGLQLYVNSGIGLRRHWVNAGAYTDAGCNSYTHSDSDT